MEEPLPKQPSAPPPPLPRGPLSPLAAVLCVLGGVVLPLASLAVEIPTHTCADVFFDPLPTWIHALLYALIPAAVIAGVLGSRRPGTGLLAGLATGMAGAYTLVFLPLTPLAVVAIPFMGLGLCALSPMTSFGTLLFLRRRLPPPGYLPGVGLALLLLVLLELPVLTARAGVALARSPDPDVRARGMGLLRQTDEVALRTLCYGDFQRPLDFVGNTVGLLRTNPDEAREMYYRAYGRPFNSLPRPPLPGQAGTRGDWEQGGTAVGSRLEGLELISSSVAGELDADALVGYLEWTLVFRNDRPAQAEARCEAALPPGAVVSRATLWIDGQEREAAFGSREAAREAYERVVQRRRDPLLVTTSGPDRVLVQCFPVPQDGGTMKIRLGLTVPLQAPDGQHAWLSLPRFAERNFEMDCRHRVAVEPRSRMEPAPPEDLDDASLARPETGILLGRTGDGSSWCPDPEGKGKVIVSRLLPATVDPSGPVVVAVDGSAGMAPHREALADALEQAGRPVDLLVSTDTGVIRPGAAGPAPAREAADFLRRFRFQGGRDAAPLLEEASRLRGEGPVLWVNAPQPVMLEYSGPWNGRIVDVPVEVGPHLVRAELSPDVLEPLLRRGPLQEDLLRFLRQGPSPALARTVEDGPPPSGASETSDHLARLQAADRIRTLAAAGDRKEAVKLAVTRQLVTEVSGAVVLETKQQYEQAGLEPVDPGSVPTIPEPSTALLVALAAGVAARARRRRAR